MPKTFQTFVGSELWTVLSSLSDRTVSRNARAVFLAVAASGGALSDDQERSYAPLIQQATADKAAASARLQALRSGRKALPDEVSAAEAAEKQAGVRLLSLIRESRRMAKGIGTGRGHQLGVRFDAPMEALVAALVLRYRISERQILSRAVRSTAPDGTHLLDLARYVCSLTDVEEAALVQELLTTSKYGS